MRGKHKIAIILVGLLILLTSCSGEKVSIDDGEITESTIALNQDGTVEMGIVEDFSQEYYDFEECKSFIETSVDEFCKANGKDSASFKYSKKNKDKIYITIAFDSIESYAKYNNEDVKLYKIKEAIDAGIMPEAIEKADKSGPVQVDTLKDGGYYVAVWKGKYQLIVEGKISHYKLGIILNENTIQTSVDDSTIVVFK